MADELDDAIAENAVGPLEVTTDAGTVKQHGLKDQIAADQYLASKKAARRKDRGIRITQIVTRGPVC